MIIKYYKKHTIPECFLLTALRRQADFRHVVLICFALFAFIADAETLRDSTSVIFNQSKSELDLNLGNNRAELERLLNQFKTDETASPSAVIKNILVIGGTSPEGTIYINDLLSHQRAENIFTYFTERLPEQTPQTEFKAICRDWNGLYRLVTEDNRVPYRSEVLELLQPVKNKLSLLPKESDKLLADLKKLRGGIPYNYLFIHQFPHLRNSRLYVEYEDVVPEVIVDTLTEDFPDVDVDMIYPEPQLNQEYPIEKDDYRPFYMGVKTNLLSDVLAIPSIGVEFYLGKNWTVGGNWAYGWWDRNRLHRYWRAYGGDIELRKWFGSAADKKPLTGHHIGVYAGVFTYDFEFGGKGYMGGKPGHSLWDRCMFTAGVEYGYSLPIAKRLNLDFTLGIGYVTGKVVKYHPKDKFYVWDSTKRINMVLPTKLEVSLVWLIGRGNYNTK